MAFDYGNFSPFDITPILGKSHPFQFQPPQDNWTDSINYATPLPDVHTPSPFGLNEPSAPVNMGSVFDVLSPEEQDLAVKRGKQAYGGALLNAAFNGSWEALGTAFPKADVARQEVTRKSKEESLKQTHENMKFLQDTESEKLKQALDTARIAEEKRKTGVLERQDTLMQQMMTNNPGVQQAFTDYQDHADKAADPDLRKAYAIKLTSAKAQYSLYMSSGTAEGMSKAMEVVGKLADEVGSDALDREKFAKIEQAKAAEQGYGTDVAAYRKAQQAQDEAYTNRALRPPQGRAPADNGINPNTYYRDIGRIEEKAKTALSVLMSSPSTSARVKAAADLGITFVPGKDMDENNEFTPEFLAKVKAIDPSAFAEKTAKSRLELSGQHVKGQGEDASSSDDPELARLKKKYPEPVAAAVFEAKKHGAGAVDIAALIRKLKGIQ